MSVIFRFFLMALIINVLGKILPGVLISDYYTAIMVTIVLILLNIFVKPFLELISLPITFITLGLFRFVINAVIILLTSELIKGFQVENFLAALLFSVCLSFVYDRF